MTNAERSAIIQIAIREYRNAKLYGGDASHQINMMENVYLMCSNWSTPGIGELRKLILSAKEVPSP